MLTTISKWFDLIVNNVKTFTSVTLFVIKIGLIVISISTGVA